MLTVAFPVYSRARDFGTAIALRRRIVRAHSTVLFPFLLLLAAEAAVLVPWVYGEQWADAAEPLQWIAVGGLAAAVLTGTGPIVMAAGRPDAMLKYNLFAFIGYVAALTVGASIGLQAACAAFVAFQTCNLLAAQHFLLGRIVGIPFRELASDTGAALVGGVLLFAVAREVTVRLDDAGMPAPAVLAAATAAGVAVYAAVLRFAFPTAWRDLWLLVDRVAFLSRLRRVPRAASRVVKQTGRV
jgi:O-antigen/teichoic acid export membrane protein